ncbi:MAG TPA: hypothetical protein VEK38_03620 [Candidatus Bathyarchaeia archaeon]|nr:hypothetical protein [Candidatus Bathyarchaeia archaeon]
MKKLYTALVIVTIIYLSLFSAGRHPISLETKICAGFDTQCHKNSATDIDQMSVEWSLQGVRIQNFGRLEEPTTRFFAIPPFGEKRIYQFTPTTGTFANNTIEALLVSFSPQGPFSTDVPPSLMHDIQTMNPATIMIKIYRRFVGNKIWTWVADFELSKNDLPPSFEKQVTIMPDGVIEIQKLMEKNEATGTVENVDVSLDFSKY